VYLAQGLLIGCEDRAVNAIIIAAIGMLLAAYAGRLLAARLQKKSV